MLLYLAMFASLPIHFTQSERTGLGRNLHIATNTMSLSAAIRLSGSRMTRASISVHNTCPIDDGNHHGAFLHVLKGFYGLPSDAEI